MSRDIVEVEMTFLEGLAVIALRIGQAKQSLFQKVTGRNVSAPRFRGNAQGSVLLFVPKSECDVLKAMRIAHACNAVFSPPVRSFARHVMVKVAPRISVRGVILADCRPLSLRSIRTPALPVSGAFAILLQPLLFLTEELLLVDDDHDEAMLSIAYTAVSNAEFGRNG